MLQAFVLLAVYAAALFTVSVVMFRTRDVN
jgi:hypothetical protein